MNKDETAAVTPGPPAARRWPYILIIFLLAAVLIVALWRPWNDPSGKPPPVISQNPRPAAPFELIVTNLVKNRQRLELLEVELEYWQEHRVERDIVSIKKGSMTDRVARLAPDWIKKQVMDSDWNRTEAHIITKCQASVEFEVDFDNADQWQVEIDGDMARIRAPAYVVDEVNVPPEKLQGWVIEEDFMISGKKERDELLKQVRLRLIPHVKSKSFRHKHREQCRQNLRRFFQQLFQTVGDERLKQVKHIYVQFADDPKSGAGKD